MAWLGRVSGSLQLGLPFVWVATGSAHAHVWGIPDPVSQPSCMATGAPTWRERIYVCAWFRHWMCDKCICCLILVDALGRCICKISSGQI